MVNHGALAGLRVLDVTQVMAGPFCTMLLADFGADVVKIEPPGGDSTRSMPGGSGTDSPSFNALNRGKRSAVVNLKTAGGREALQRLARTADIFVENYRPGVVAALGLDFPSLHALNPRLIYASISGYGQTGPDAHKGGFDLVAQGVSGIMSITGEAAGRPVKAGVPLTDLGAGLFALAGILAALEHRHRSGVGQHIDTSLVEAGVALSVWEATEYFAGLGIPQPKGSAHRMFAPYQAVRCADGYITLGTANDRLFRRLCDLLDHPEWSTEPQFADNLTRVRNHAALAAPDRGHHQRASPPLLAGPVRSERHPVRSDQQLRAGFRRPADQRARNGRRRRTPGVGDDEGARIAAEIERDAHRRAPPRADARRTYR